ncbi:MAG TPA: endoglucanase, partial [Phenylobacterium sp.]|nr:endoglucanase [Phenylobacterium sp.]
DYSRNEPRQAAYPQMSWGSNYRLAANGIMWTLFWAGRLLTPDFRIEGENVQDFLQGRYLGAMEAVARRVAHLPNVLGFDTLNEPGPGWIGEPMSYRHLGPSAENPSWARAGAALSPLDNLAIAAGVPTRTTILGRNPSTGATEPTDETVINPHGVRIWRDGAVDPFEAAGAWRREGDGAVALDEDFFRIAQGRRLDLSEDGYGPLFGKVGETIRRHNPDWSVFAELDPFGAATGRRFPRDLPERTVNASHWYDVRTLFLKRFGAGKPGGPAVEDVAARYLDQLAACHKAGAGFPGGAPTLIGEFGIPFDLDEGADYEAWASGRREGRWADHVLALSLMYDALDALQLHATQWNYTASNRNSAVIGDGWNQEDLSIYSSDQRTDSADPDDGGRAVEGFCRPFARRIQGRLRHVRFDRDRRRLTIEYDADPRVAAPTEIYAPRVQYPMGFSVRVEGLPCDLQIDPQTQKIEIVAMAAGRARVIVEPPRTRS